MALIQNGTKVWKHNGLGCYYFINKDLLTQLHSVYILDWYQDINIYNTRLHNKPIYQNLL